MSDFLTDICLKVICWQPFILAFQVVWSFPAGKMRAELLETEPTDETYHRKVTAFFPATVRRGEPHGKKCAKKPALADGLLEYPFVRHLDRDPLKTKVKILAQLRPGSVILLHDHTRFTEHHLEELISAIQDGRIRKLWPLDVLLNIPAYVS